MNDEFEVGDEVIEIGGNVVYKVRLVASYGYIIDTDYPIPTRLYVMKKDEAKMLKPWRVKDAAYRHIAWTVSASSASS